MLRADFRDIVSAEVIAWEAKEEIYGVSYVTKTGLQTSEKVGTKSEAEAVVRRIEMVQSSQGGDSPANPFPRDIAAS
jgi:hypothetical protein